MIDKKVKILLEIEWEELNIIEESIELTINIDSPVI